MTQAQTVLPSPPPPPPVPPPENRAPDEGRPDVPVTFKNLLTHPRAHAIILDIAAGKALGPEWIGWDDETVWQELHRAFGTPISAANRAKLRAIQSCHASFLPWESWHVFEKVGQALAGNPPMWEVMQPMLLEDLLVAVDCMKQIRDAAFSDECRAYIAACCLHEDVFLAIPPIEFAQPELSQPQYLCRDCGTVEPALFHDGYCSSCSGKFAPERGLSMRPSDEAIKSGKGQNVEVRLRYDPVPVRTLWDKFKDAPSGRVPHVEDDPAYDQLARLLVARDLLAAHRARYEEQYRAIRSWVGSQ